MIVSRGELVEIGGSFRLPEILEVSGARLREVGTTNRTRLSDYERAIGPETAAILRVHRSNFRIVGFTEAPELSDLVRLAHDRGIWLIDDIGSGAIRADILPQAGDEPTATEAIAAGADLVLVLRRQAARWASVWHHGRYPRRRSISLEADPLMRALRLDKMTLAALEATLCARARFRARGRADSPLVDGRHAGRRSLEACDCDRRHTSRPIRLPCGRRGG